MHLREMKIGQSEVIAISYEAYKKQHPGTKKTKTDPMFKKPHQELSPEEHETKMKDIAGKVGHTFDGHGDNRIHHNEQHRVDASEMSEKEYDDMEKDIAKHTVKGKGYEVGAWNDSSGHKYWNEGSKDGDHNYIQTTAYITDPKNVDHEALKRDLDSVHNHFSKYHSDPSY